MGALRSGNHVSTFIDEVHVSSKGESRGTQASMGVKKRLRLGATRDSPGGLEKACICDGVDSPGPASQVTTYADSLQVIDSPQIECFKVEGMDSCPDPALVDAIIKRSEAVERTVYEAVRQDLNGDTRTPQRPRSAGDVRKPFYPR